MRAVLLAMLVVLATGCSREIGDECSSNTDCGENRICDLSQKGGYCTITPCRPGDCPGEAVCVEFNKDTSYCMRACDGQRPCRTGYVCVTDFNGIEGFCDQAQPPTE